jgi:hypothetical protein
MKDLCRSLEARAVPNIRPQTTDLVVAFLAGSRKHATNRPALNEGVAGGELLENLNSIPEWASGGHSDQFFVVVLVQLVSGAQWRLLPNLGSRLCDRGPPSGADISAPVAPV